MALLIWSRMMARVWRHCLIVFSAASICCSICAAWTSRSAIWRLRSFLSVLMPRIVHDQAAAHDAIPWLPFSGNRCVFRGNGPVQSSRQFAKLIGYDGGMAWLFIPVEFLIPVGIVGFVLTIAYDGGFWLLMLFVGAVYMGVHGLYLRIRKKPSSSTRKNSNE